MSNNNIISTKSKAFALRVIKLYNYLIENHRIFPVANQILKSGTEYWLELLHESSYITTEQFESLYYDCQEILKILVSITKTQNNS